MVGLANHLFVGSLFLLLDDMDDIPMIEPTDLKCSRCGAHYVLLVFENGTTVCKDRQECDIMIELENG